MAEISRAQQSFSEIELLLKEEKYQDAKDLLTQRIKQNPGDRESALYILLVNVSLHGLWPYDEEIQRLRTVSDFSDAEKDIVRRLFLLAFTIAEKEGKEKQAWVYQRLLRRLLINQPLDQSIPQGNPAGAAAHSPAKVRVPRLERPATTKAHSNSHWRSALPRAWSRAFKPNLSGQVIALVAAVGLLVAAVLYLWLIQGQSTGDQPQYAIPIPPSGADSVLLMEPIALSGGSAAKAETIEKIVVDRLPNLQQTYHEWAHENQKLVGSLLVKIKLDAAGNVVKAETVAARIPDAKFRNVVIEQLRNWKFAKANAGAAEFAFSLLFVPQGIEPAGIARWEKALEGNIPQAKTALMNGGSSAGKRSEETGDYMIPWNFVLLLVAILLWAMSLFLVAEAAKSLKWICGERVGGPRPSAGVDMSQLLSCFFVLLWLARQLLLAKSNQDPFSFFSELLVNPEPLTPGILLAVFPPLIVGMMKLITALGATREEIENQVQRRNQVWINAVILSLHVMVGVGATMFLMRSFV